MKSILPVLAFALVAGLTAPVLAETTATGIGTGIANATAGAENNFGNTFGGASIGGAYCVDTVVIGPFGGSKTMRPCVAAQVAESAGKLGTMSAAEVRAIQLAVLKDVGYVLKPADKSTASTKDKAPAKTTVATKSSPADGAITVKVLASSATEMKLRVNGMVYVVKGEKLATWKSGGKLNFDGAKLRMSDLPA